MEYKKIGVEVSVRFSAEGGMTPLEIVWADGKSFRIERVTSVLRAPHSVDSVLPVKYTVVIGGDVKALYYEPQEELWFVETKV